MKNPIINFIRSGGNLVTEEGVLLIIESCQETVNEAAKDCFMRKAFEKAVKTPGRSRFHDMIEAALCNVREGDKK